MCCPARSNLAEMRTISAVPGHGRIRQVIANFVL
jgi:hypothetical protein